MEEKGERESEREAGGHVQLAKLEEREMKSLLSWTQYDALSDEVCLNNVLPARHQRAFT